ncbi:MAG TPA: ABC transporter ATP-binding protein [Chthoniobacteraceae bacterium]|jgi:lipopolysaccharide transport system ATP-binding protein|nr:ABC transporter ATP-binding protein [Chthoniobacteraceae bacterium]
MGANDIAISIRGLSKAYVITHQQEKHSTLAETLLHKLKNPAATFGGSKETFWALKDISFDVNRGDVVGVVGRNGAGKSTLLKILSRITEPTLGEIDLYGRVGSLLEVGTGFHPELTGRENIYLNGAILGMSKREIARQFDGIVDFAGVEKFLDTPVKRYSSGMYVRLAFAVAAHLNPEILIVDEVLAVGDAEFQKKCLGKMKDVAKGGRTVLFVSHNMAAVQNLCTRGIMLRSGQILVSGDVDEVVSAYLSEGISSMDGRVDLSDHPARAGRSAPWLKSMTFIGDGGRPSSRFASSRPISVVVEVAPPRPIANPRVAIAIEDHLGRRIGTAASYFNIGNSGRYAEPFTAMMTLDKVNLGPGRYLMSVSIAEPGGGLLDSLDSAAFFDVEWDSLYKTGERHDPAYGPVVIHADWEVVPGVTSTALA